MNKLDAYRELQSADPVARLFHEVDTTAPAPEDVLVRLISTPRDGRRMIGPSRRRIVMATASFAAVAVIASISAMIAVRGGEVDLAAKAYAATSPDGAVLYSQWTIVSGTEGWQNRSRIDHWQRGETVHQIRVDHPARVAPHRTEYVMKADDVLRVRQPNGRSATLRPSDGAFARREIWVVRQNFVQYFRSLYARGRLRDAGLSTFKGKPTHSYVGASHPVPTGRQTSEYFLDRTTGVPVGATTKLVLQGADGPLPALRTTVTVTKLQRLEPTPENLAKLRPQFRGR